MAVKSKLETVFTGNDKPFQKVAGRVEHAGRRMAKMAGKLSVAFGGIGVAMAASKALEKFDRIGKLSKRFDVSAEALQRLGFAAEQNGASMELVAKAMQTANRNAIEATRGLLTYTRAFDDLAVDAASFAKLDQEKQFLTIADAIAKAADKNKALAAAQTIMGRSAVELIPLLKMGRAEIEKLSGSVAVLDAESVRSIEAFNDAINKVKTDSMVAVGEAIVFVINAVENLEEVLSKFDSNFQSKYAKSFEAATSDKAVEDFKSRFEAKEAEREARNEPKKLDIDPAKGLEMFGKVFSKVGDAAGDLFKKKSAFEFKDIWEPLRDSVADIADRIGEKSEEIGGARFDAPRELGGFGTHRGSDRGRGFNRPVSSAAERSAKATEAFFREAKARDEKMLQASEAQLALLQSQLGGAN